MFRIICRCAALALLCWPAMPLHADTASEPSPSPQSSSPAGVTAPADAPAESAIPRLAPEPPPELRDELPPLATIDLTTPPDDLWQRIRNGFGMADLDSPLVADRQAWYLNRPAMLQQIIRRSRKYLHHIVSELERRGMPAELALLPMVESAFNPMARSPARALGMWQFIPSTGKNYNLDQNWWRDERRDIIASTSAALDYLQNIYEMHGDWHLALASYNWGENAVARAVTRNQARGLPTDYPNLTMPGETRYYVPKLQALKNIIARPELFGFELGPIPNEPYFDTVDIPGDMDVALAAKLAELPLEDFIALNPAYHRPVIRGGRDAQLVLPADKVQTFLDNLDRHEAQAKPLASWRTYTLKPGERLEGVASRFGLGIAYIKHLNGITPRMKIGPGSNLLLPGPGAQLTAQLAAQLPRMPTEPVRIVKGKHKGAGAPSVRAKAYGKRMPTAKATAKPVAKARAHKPPTGKHR